MRFLFISTMKNEGPYILEWLAYHKAIGFTDFLVYTNDCTDGSDLMLDRLAASGHLVHERNDVLRRGPHKSALKYALAHPLYAQADWVFVGDADEFLNVRTGNGHITDLTAAFEDADAIPVAWRMFSGNGEVGIEDGLLARLTEAEPEEPDPGNGRFVKTLFRKRQDVARLGLHGPVYEEGAQVNWRARWLDKDPDADPLRPVKNFGYELAQINHYAVRSVDAFLAKRDRGRANHVNETLGLSYWQRWALGGSEDRSIQRHGAAVAAGVRDFARDPIVGALHKASLEWHRARVAELVKDPQVSALRDQIMALPGVNRAQKEPGPQAALAVKAPGRHANRLKMLEKMPKNGIAAEVGVWNGGFSAAILDVTEPKELVLIDPWDLLADQKQETWTHQKHEDALAMGAMYTSVMDRYQSHRSVSVRKGFSAEVLASFPDNYFDWVYIDGNHLYDFVRRDVEISFDKVRPGGCIAGDDFFWKRDGRMHVREAVFDVLREKGLSGSHQRMGQQFMIWLPQ